MKLRDPENPVRKGGFPGIPLSQGTEMSAARKSQCGLELWGFQLDINCAHSRVRALDL